MTKFKVGDKVIFKDEVRTIKKINIYNNSLSGVDAINELWKRASFKEYTLNEIDISLWFENYANGEELKPANSIKIRERLGIK